MTNAGIFKNKYYGLVIKTKASNYGATFLTPEKSVYWYKGWENERVAPPTMTSWKS